MNKHIKKKYKIIRIKVKIKINKSINEKLIEKKKSSISIQINIYI